MINFVNLFYYLAYFCYYLWISLYFLILFIDPTILFFNYLFHFITVLSAKSFQFQQNKWIPNKPLVCVWQKLKNQLILLFSLFLLLFMNSTTFFGTIYGFHCTISANFYLYL